jgi:hypothetical protein
MATTEAFAIDDGTASTVHDTAEWAEMIEQCASFFGSDSDAGEDEESDDGFWEMADMKLRAAAPNHEEEEQSGDLSRQRDEAEAMAAMYPDSFSQVSATEWLFRSPISKTMFGEMRIRLPRSYPSLSPPWVSLDIPGVLDLQGIVRKMRKEYKPDAEVGFPWAERFEELCRVVRERREKAAADKEASRKKEKGIEIEETRPQQHAVILDEHLVAELLGRRAWSDYSTGRTACCQTCFYGGLHTGFRGRTRRQVMKSCTAMGSCAVSRWVVEAENRRRQAEAEIRRRQPSAEDQRL